MSSPAEEKVTIRPLPDHGPCFICGDGNPKGMGLTWYEQKTAVQHTIFAEFEYSIHEQGPPGHAHGGAIAAVMDEVMGAMAWRSGLKVVLANMNLDYRRPVPLNTPIRVEAELERRDGRKAYVVGRLLVDGETAVESRGLFIHAPHMFENNTFYG